MAIANPYNYKKPIGQKQMPVNRPVSKPVKQQPQDAYLEQKVMSAKPEELTYMLYDALVKNIKKAILFIDKKDISKVNEASKKAQDIISELMVTLNQEVAISQDFMRLYDYMERALIEGNIAKDKKAFENALSVAEDFKTTWAEAFKIRG